jgi:hypothetical protein
MAAKQGIAGFNDRSLARFDREKTGMGGYLNIAFSLAPPRRDFKQNEKPDR